MPSNVVLCGRPALLVDIARRWRPIRTSYELGDRCATSNHTSKRAHYLADPGFSTRSYSNSALTCCTAVPVSAHGIFVAFQLMENQYGPR